MLTVAVHFAQRNLLFTSEALDGPLPLFPIQDDE